MNERLKQLRKVLKLTQQEFADKLNIKRGTIANYEIGRNEPIDAVITLICKEFGVNEVWLRTGEGGEENMFTQVSDEDRFSLSLGKLSMTDNRFLQNALIALAETEPEKLKIIEEFMKGCLGIKERE